MPNNQPGNYNLIPEAALLAPLPSHIRRRFMQALELMHQGLALQLTWEQIARQSAISPSHFHRQFKALFNETPGHYLSRLRLQFATEQLLRFPEQSITDIAHKSGFSESQALAKALKRTLGHTAKAIKQMATHATPQQTADLMAKLAQPFMQGTMEQALAENIPAELLWVSQRSAKILEVDNCDWQVLAEQFGAGCASLMVLNPVNQLDLAWQHIDVRVCDLDAEACSHNFLLKEGFYLSAVVTLRSAVGYLAAVDGLFTIAMQRGLAIDSDGYFTEQLLAGSDEHGATLLFQLPIVD
ncbi:helix-turn-helix transcriptional regulator [Alkalimonas amylolytica]|uniref:AraC-type DNA-binding protein n=1 Tax=Alkalimonas amylolytica TaxID=152573 RepID=A0A1H3X313_ALKAM|nr:helix-turn-helix transcriptional regulator [Alkalimonas amylolytica]SDZ93777.1 AraC-type DNA-binding protein [Alkalimonas amylolytica]